MHESDRCRLNSAKMCRTSPTTVLHLRASKCSGVGAVESKTPGGLKTKSFGQGFGEDELNNSISRKDQEGPQAVKKRQETFKQE